MSELTGRLYVPKLYPIDAERVEVPSLALRSLRLWERTMWERS